MLTPRMPSELLVKAISASHPDITEEVEHAGPLLDEGDIGLVHRIPPRLRRTKFFHPIVGHVPDGLEPLLVRFERGSHSVNLFTVQPVEFWDSLVPVGDLLNPPADLAHLPEDCRFVEQHVFDLAAYLHQRVGELLEKWCGGRHPKVETIRVMGQLLHHVIGDQVAVRTVIVALRSVPERRRPSKALSDIVVENLKLIQTNA